MSADSRTLLAKLGRFASVGVVNTIIDFVLFGVLRQAGIGLLIANLVSTTAGMTFGFFAHRSYSFRYQSRSWQDLVRFVLVTLVGIWAIQPVCIWAGAAMLGRFGLMSPLGQVWLPKGAGIAAGMCWSFMMYNYFVFADRRKPHEGS